MSDILTINGSARLNGNTQQFINKLTQEWIYNTFYYDS